MGTEAQRSDLSKVTRLVRGLGVMLANTYVTQTERWGRLGAGQPNPEHIGRRVVSVLFILRTREGLGGPLTSGTRGSQSGRHCSLSPTILGLLWLPRAQPVLSTTPSRAGGVPPPPNPTQQGGGEERQLRDWPRLQAPGGEWKRSKRAELAGAGAAWSPIKLQS